MITVVEWMIPRNSFCKGCSLLQPASCGLTPRMRSSMDARPIAGRGREPRNYSSNPLVMVFLQLQPGIVITAFRFLLEIASFTGALGTTQPPIAIQFSSFFGHFRHSQRARQEHTSRDHLRIETVATSSSRGIHESLLVAKWSLAAQKFTAGLTSSIYTGQSPGFRMRHCPDLRLCPQVAAQELGRARSARQLAKKFDTPIGTVQRCALAHQHVLAQASVNPIIR
jgi:hypothetical protein